MNNLKLKSKSLSQKQIPTILGLLLLVAALIAGVVFFGEGTGVFTPRATPETTPKNIRITNIKDDSFTVSFYTEEATPGFIKYGTVPDKLNSQVRDDRDQLSGSVDNFNLHHITVRGLEPNTDYYLVLGTGSRAEFDQDGQPFQVKTPRKPASTTPETVTIFGSVALENGTPAQGSVIYITSPNIQELSSLVKSSGSWAISISQALNKTGDDYASVEPEDQITVLVQGVAFDKRIQHQLSVKDAQPAELVFGQEQAIPDVADVADVEDKIINEPVDDEQGLAEPAGLDLEVDKKSVLDSVESDTQPEKDVISNNLKDLLDEEAPLPQTSTASAELLIGELNPAPDKKTFTTQSPTIRGKAVPNAEVKIQVHSEVRYEQTVVADENGQFSLDLEALKATLDPGEHTVTYSYIDPETGLEVVKTEFFYVEDPDKVTLAMADPTPTTAIPYGTGDPYPMTSPTTTPTASQVLPTVPAATSSTDTARQQKIATDGTYKAGSVGTTTLVAFSGIFFILIGLWSWWLAGELAQEE